MIYLGRVGVFYLEPLVYGELDEGEGNFAHDRGNVARVETSQAAAPQDRGHRLPRRRVQAGLHLLLDVFGGYSNQTRHLKLDTHTDPPGPDNGWNRRKKRYIQITIQREREGE